MIPKTKKNLYIQENHCGNCYHCSLPNQELGNEQ